MTFIKLPNWQHAKLLSFYSMFNNFKRVVSKRFILLRSKPMIITDLNHLETVSEGTEVRGGGGYYSYYQNDKVKFDVKTDINIDDNSAEAFGDSYAYGDNSFTKTVTLTKVNGHSSYSGSASFGAVD
jgi:hypothetical protein